MSDYYTTKDASELTGASRQIIRTYTGAYARYFSTEATPEPGQQRRFTSADLKLIKYIYSLTSDQNLTHEQVQERLAAGGLDEYDWQPPQPLASAQPGQTDQSAMLIPVERLQAAQALLQAEKLERERLIEREQTLQGEINSLQRDRQGRGRVVCAQGPEAPAA